MNLTTREAQVEGSHFSRGRVFARWKRPGRRGGRHFAAGTRFRASKALRVVRSERPRTAHRRRNIHPYPRNRRSAVFNWKWDAANVSAPGSIAPAATANSKATTIGPAMLGAADARANSTRARSTRSAFISSFRARAAVRAADTSTRVPVTSISIPGGAPGTGVARAVRRSSTSSSLGGIILIASAVTRVASPAGNRSASGIPAMRSAMLRRASSSRPKWLTAVVARAMATKTAAKAEWMRSVRDGTAVPPTFLRFAWGYKRPDHTFSQAIDLGAHA